MFHSNIFKIVLLIKKAIIFTFTIYENTIRYLICNKDSQLLKIKSSSVISYLVLTKVIPQIYKIEYNDAAH